VINESDLENGSLKFLQKYSSLQVDQDSLPKAFKYCSWANPATVAIRDPYFNFEFIKELIKSSFFENGTLSYNFTRVKFEPEEWRQIQIGLQDGSLPLLALKQKIKNQFVVYLRKKMGELHPKERDEINTKVRSLRIFDSNKLLFCLYLLKDNFNRQPFQYFKDTSAHWHHRFVLIENQLTKSVFESSHSFIYRQRRHYYSNELEPLHFRCSDKKEFERFHNSFEKYECFTFPYEP